VAYYFCGGSEKPYSRPERGRPEALPVPYCHTSPPAHAHCPPKIAPPSQPTMPRKSAGETQSGGSDAPPTSSIDDGRQSTTVGGASFRDVDLASTFPTTKIKAQILRDEGVGRISSKAIQLIGAASAIFVRELAEAAVLVSAENENGDGDEQSQDSPSMSPSKVEAKGRKRKLSSRNRKSNPDGNLSDPIVSDPILTRDHIKDCIEEDAAKFDFLHGLLGDNISAKEIPAYGAAYQKKVRREAVHVGSKSTKGKSAIHALAGKGVGEAGRGSGNTKDAAAAAVGATSVFIGSATGAGTASASSAGGDEEALQAVIDASLQDDNELVRLDDGIVQDDEEYD